MPTPKSSTEKLADLGISTLRTVLAAWMTLQSGEFLFMADIAKKLNIDSNTLQRRLDRFERCVRTVTGQAEGGKGKKPEVKFQLIKRTRGSRAIANLNSVTVQLMQNVAELVASHQRVMESFHLPPPTIRFAASMTACHYLAPVLSQFQSDREVLLDISHAKPLRLRKAAVAAENDLVLVAVSKDFDANNDHVIDCIDLPIALVCPKGHWTEAKYPTDSADKNDRPTWQTLEQGLIEHNDKILCLKSGPDRYPMPPYPAFSWKLRVNLVTSTMLCCSMIMRGEKNVALLPPQFFLPSQREFIHIVQVKDLPTIRMALIRPPRVPTAPPLHQENTDPNDKRKEELVGELAEVLKNALEDMEKQEPTVLRRHVYHASLSRGEPSWIHANLTLCVDRNREHSNVRHVTGSYGLKLSTSSHTHQYQISGDCIENDTTGRHHLACRAIGMNRRLGETFTFSCFFENYKMLDNGTVVGTWQGRSLGHQERREDGTESQFIPAIGVIVISAEPQTTDQLNTLAQSYRSKYELVIL